MSRKTFLMIARLLYNPLALIVYMYILETYTSNNFVTHILTIIGAIAVILSSISFVVDSSEELEAIKLKELQNKRKGSSEDKVCIVDKDKRYSIVMLVGDSGVGKSYTLKQLEEYGYINVVSVTTRAKRDSDRVGIDYNFVSHDEFNNLELVEKIEIGDNRYGIAEKDFLSAIEKSDGKVVFIVEPNGVLQILKWLKHNKHKITELDTGIDVDIIHLKASREIRYERLVNEVVSKTSKLTFEDVIAINVRLDRFNPNSNIFLDMFPSRVKTELRTKLDTLIEALRLYNIMVVVIEHSAKSIDDDMSNKLKYLYKR